MANPRPRRRLCWLLSAPLALVTALPVCAQEALPGQRLAAGADTGWLAQKPPNEEAKIPAEVQGWFDGAKAAASKGEAAEALRLQKKVVAWLEATPGAPVVFRARALMNLGVFLSALGQRQEALGPTQEAVRLLRPLEGSRGDARRFLAMALNNLGNFYSELGRRQEALAPTEETVKIYLELAKSNPASLGDLASSLSKLGIRYFKLGRHHEALAPSEEAVKINRELAKSNPASLGDLAGSLSNLGNHYSELGRRQEALAPSEEAVKINRELAKTNTARLGNLAISLHNLGIRYSELGRRREALAHKEEAVKIFRELAKSNPAFLIDLATSLNNLGLAKKDLGEPEQARVALEESLTIIQPLAAANPAFQDGLQRFLNNLENLNRQEGLRTGERKLVAPTDLTYLPKDDPNTPLRRSVVRLWPTFGGQKPGSGLIGTGFVVKRQGERAWIATALHVVRGTNEGEPAIKVEAELYAGSLPKGMESPRLVVSTPPSQAPAEGGDDLIILEVQGLPPDVQPLPLSAAQPSGILKVVGHPTDKPPWAVATFPILKATDQQLVLDGELQPGASGSPVLNASGQVLGLVYETATYARQALKLVLAYRTSAIQAKIP